MERVIDNHHPINLLAYRTYLSFSCYRMYINMTFVRMRNLTNDDIEMK